MKSQAGINTGATGFYSKRQVKEKTSLSDATIWRLVRAGKFPKPVPISPGRVGFDRLAVDWWLQERLDA